MSAEDATDTTAGDAPAGGPLDELKSAMFTLSGGEGIPFPEAQLPELLGLVDASVGAVISAVFAELSAGTEPASASVDGMIDGILEKLQAAAAEAEEGGEASAEPTEVITAEEPTEGAPAAEEAPVPQNAVVTADEPAPASDEPVVPVEEAVVESAEPAARSDDAPVPEPEVAPPAEPAAVATEPEAADAAVDAAIAAVDAVIIAEEAVVAESVAEPEPVAAEPPAVVAAEPEAVVAPEVVPEPEPVAVVEPEAAIVPEPEAVKAPEPPTVVEAVPEPAVPAPQPPPLPSAPAPAPVAVPSPTAAPAPVHDDGSVTGIVTMPLKPIQESAVAFGGLKESRRKSAALVGLKSGTPGSPRAGAGGEVQHIHSDFGKHSYAVEEEIAFSEHLNHILAFDAYLTENGYLPIGGENTLFKALSDGIVICKLINVAMSDQVDERALNLPGKDKPLNKWERQENGNLAIGAAKSLGCSIVNIHAGDIINCVEGHKEYLILGMVWQIVKIQLLSAINLKEIPELVKLLQPGEDVGVLRKLSPENILLRWVNYHLRLLDDSPPIGNFGGDLETGEAYVKLMHRLYPTVVPLSLLEDTTPEARADALLAAAKEIGIPAIIKQADIVSGNKRLNLAFVAQIFNNRHGFDIPDKNATAAQAAEFAAEIAALTEEAAEPEEVREITKEERMFKTWLNSLDMGDSGQVQDVFDSISNNLALLRAIDNVRPGTVDWKRVHTSKLNKFKLVENANYAVSLCKDVLKLKLTGVGGVDLYSKNHTLVLGILWQLMREETINLLKSVAPPGASVSDSDILAWANKTLSAAGKTASLASFKDSTLSDSVYLLDLIAAVRPRAVNADLIKKGEELTPEEKELNAKYVLSVARKIGASCFGTWEDIVEVKPKTIMLLVASIMQVALDGEAEK